MLEVKATEKPAGGPVSIEYHRDALDEKDRVYYERLNPGYQVTPDILKITEAGGSTTHVIVKGNNTPVYMVRDCGDYFIRALSDRYQRIDKMTLQITDDVKDI